MRIKPLHRRAGEGYVLLAVIAVSVLVISALASLARLSLRRGLEASDAERLLQQRWGARTLERVMLQQAPSVFEQQEALLAEEAPGNPTPTTIRAMLRLGDVNFDILLGDEDAKLNLNAIYHHGGPQRVAAAVARHGGPLVGAAVRLLPAVAPLSTSPRAPTRSDDDQQEDEPQIAIPDAFRSWGELFDVRALDAGLARDADLPNLTTGLTLWGSGQLNFRRASDETILAVASLVVQDGAARRIVERYRENPTATLAVLLQTEVSREPDRRRLAELMSESSSNFSIWIDAASIAGSGLRSFTVMRRDDEGVIRTTRFRH